MFKKDEINKRKQENLLREKQKDISKQIEENKLNRVRENDNDKHLDCLISELDSKYCEIIEKNQQDRKQKTLNFIKKNYDL
ncbi:MAG: hypothetical protein MHPSP_001176, partial [Paramarteilia canceri]